MFQPPDLRPLVQQPPHPYEQIADQISLKGVPYDQSDSTCCGMAHARAMGLLRVRLIRDRTHHEMCGGPCCCDYNRAAMDWGVDRLELVAIYQNRIIPATASKRLGARILRERAADIRVRNSALVPA